MKPKKLVFRFLGLLKNNRRNRKRGKMIMRKFNQLNPDWKDSLQFDIEKGTGTYTYVSPKGVKTIIISHFVLNHKS
jgi:hypothetical protein